MLAQVWASTARHSKVLPRWWSKERRQRLLSDGYNTGQREIVERLPIVKQEIEDLKAAATNVERFVDIANKYTDLRELTPEVLRTFIERIIIHERTAKHSKTATQQIDIYFRYIGKLAPEQVA